MSVCMNYKMLQYERIDIYEGIYLNKSDKLKECMICQYWYLNDIGYKTLVVYDLNDFMILSIKGVDYRCYVFNMSKSDAINLLNNSVLDNKGVLKKAHLE